MDTRKRTPTKGTPSTSATSVEMGRGTMEAYVAYSHYIEGIHATLMPAEGHPYAAP